MESLLQRFSLKEKVVIVTGGTGILGTVYCKALAEAGAIVIISDLKEDKCRELANEINADFGEKCAQGFQVDLTSEESVVHWRQNIVEVYGNVDVLLNNAATKSPNFFAPLEKFSVGDWNHVMAVNVTGMFLACREIGSLMAQRGKGSIINVSSVYGVVGPDQRIYEGSWYGDMGGAINTPLVYSASKGAVISMTRYIATYWGNKGVRTNTLTSWWNRIRTK